MTCEGCKYWSERLARSLGGGPVEAMCLNENSSHIMHYVHYGCKKHTPGPAVDDWAFDIEGGESR